MITALVTGANGFIGKNLVDVLKRREDVSVIEYDLNCTEQSLHDALGVADVIFHLAGVNRPESEEEFFKGNTNFTEDICTELGRLDRKPKIIFSSSIQVERDNPYGKSKLAGEQALIRYSEDTGAEVAIFRLPNVFGKWCRPNYNSVVATFCYNTTRGLPITISDPNNVVPLVYIDDVIEAFVKETDVKQDSEPLRYCELAKSYSISLGEMVELLNGFKESRHSLIVPDMTSSLVAKMYSTYLSYLPTDEFGYNLKVNPDDRGGLAEFIKSPNIGQIFISRTKPGITRGNHYHHTKVEKFFVVEGKGIIRFKSILGGVILEYPVDGRDFRVVDIPPGYTHSIENVGEGEMVVLFWSAELFNPEKPDTYFLKVIE